MTPSAKLIAALTTAAKKATNKKPLKQKIRKIQSNISRNNWLAQ